MPGFLENWSFILTGHTVCFSADEFGGSQTLHSLHVCNVLFLCCMPVAGYLKSVTSGPVTVGRLLDL